jgi:predicted SprT family Zn-dependent metalloprotease
MPSLIQSCFDFANSVKERLAARTLPPAEPDGGPTGRRDADLEAQAGAWLSGLGLHDGAKRVRVEWNPRMRSTAGYAKWPQWVVELNPRLKEFEGQIERTLKHEIAHLIAYARAGRRRIEPHGAIWRRACADLGIPNERASHKMPLPRSKQRRKFFYLCPSCGTTAGRVRKFKRHTACLASCKKHNGGRYDARFQFVMQHPERSQAATLSSSA